MDFIWNDGGRAACGYVGLTGDCVTRAIAIATGRAYREVYDAIGEKSLKSPRNGVSTPLAAEYLSELGWIRYSGHDCASDLLVPQLPKGIVLVHLACVGRRSGHICTLVDHVVHDTWNALEDSGYVVVDFWVAPANTSATTLPMVGSNHRVSREQQLTQNEFDKILRRLRAMDNTLSNGASTEGEKRNALRMMQSLMLTHNLTREDITGNNNVDNVQFTRVACPVNGRKATAWEKGLAAFLVRDVFPTVQWYRGTKGPRSMFWFYGPVSDVSNALALFRELLLTIATSAQLQYGSYTRGSGASYAEGYVRGLFRGENATPVADPAAISRGALMQCRELAMHGAANHWLANECHVYLTRSSSLGRTDHDTAAESRGKQHGAQHEIHTPGRPQRLTQT